MRVNGDMVTVKAAGASGARLALLSCLSLQGTGLSGNPTTWVTNCGCSRHAASQSQDESVTLWVWAAPGGGVAAAIGGVSLSSSR